jgi:nanoRNase/pAp phosphatase (c-di-AMP/oligoRNAs hydrolase)
LCQEGRADQVIQTVLQGLGTSGGHGMMAGGQIHNARTSREDQLGLERLLTRRLLKALHLAPDLANPLLAE